MGFLIIISRWLLNTFEILLINILKCWLVCNYLKSSLNLFWVSSLTEALNEWWRISEKMSVFYLIIFMCISDSWQAFVWSRLVVSLRIFSLSTISKENKSFELEALLMAFALGWFLYLAIAFRIGSKIFLQMPSQSWYSGTLRLITMLEKKVFILLAV